MNTLEQLLDNGIELNTAVSMLESYSHRIGIMNGIYEIIDINYDFAECGRDVTLRCTKCGREIHRIMISGRNKWSELIKTCPCEKEAKRKAESEKIFEKKKALLEEMKSRVGMKFGDYEIVSLDDLESKPQYTLKCKVCGAEKIVSAYPFTATDFHCTKHYQKKIKFDDSYIGETNNFLKVIDIVRDYRGSRQFLCECTACGNKKLVEPVYWENGTVKSCGCMRDELLRELNVIHGESGTRLYRVWNGMKQRCGNPYSENYCNYGGRGITVCMDWQSWEKFRDWALHNGYDENAPFGECTIDRIDVNGNYEPNNCRWVNMKVQARNKRPRRKKCARSKILKKSKRRKFHEEKNFSCVSSNIDIINDGMWR